MNGDENIPNSSPAGPIPDVDTQFYWDGLSSERLLIQECTNCGQRRFPPMPVCPYCAVAAAVICEATAGVIYSWIIVHRAFQAAFASDVPYTIATIDLDGGGRIVSRLDSDQIPRPGLRVLPYFVHHDHWSEVRFR